MIHPFASMADSLTRVFGTGVGQGGAIRRLRNQFGKEVNKATKIFNEEASGIYAAAREARDAAGFEGDIKSFLQTDGGKQYSDQLTRLHNSTFEKLDTDLRPKLRNALKDYEAMYDAPYHSRVKKDVMGIAQSDYGAMIDEARTTRSGFTVKENDKLYEYQMNEDVDIRKLKGEMNPTKRLEEPSVEYKRRLLTESDGKITRGNWETKIDGAQIDKSMYDAASALEGATEVKFDPKTGATVASDVEGAVSTWTTTARKTAKLPEDGNIRLNAGLTRKAYAESYEKEAARIAKTRAGENSGIFKQLGEAASAHPFAAAAIAVGGFALASKALDKRKEYN